MSHLTYYNYPGVGTRNQETFRYSQAVRVGDRIECAGQGEPTSRTIRPTLKDRTKSPQEAGTPTPGSSTGKSTRRSTRPSQTSS